MTVEWHDAQSDSPVSGSYSWSGPCWVSNDHDKVTLAKYDKSNKKWWTFGKCDVKKWAYADVPKVK